MRYILTKLRRGRRRNRIPHGLLASAAMMTVLVLMLTLSMSHFALPASAEINIGMPRTGDGIVTDNDGVIDSDGIAEDIPDVSDMLPGGDGSMNEGSDALDPTISGTAGSTDQATDPVTTDGKTTAEGTTDMVDDVADATGISPWVIGLILLVVVIIAVILIVWWVIGRGKRDD